MNGPAALLTPNSVDGKTYLDSNVPWHYDFICEKRGREEGTTIIPFHRLFHSCYLMQDICNMMQKIYFTVHSTIIDFCTTSTLDMKTFHVSMKISYGGNLISSSNRGMQSQQTDNSDVRLSWWQSSQKCKCAHHSWEFSAIWTSPESKYDWTCYL